MNRWNQLVASLAVFVALITATSIAFSQMSPPGSGSTAEEIFLTDFTVNSVTATSTTCTVNYTLLDNYPGSFTPWCSVEGPPGPVGTATFTSAQLLAGTHNLDVTVSSGGDGDYLLQIRFFAPPTQENPLEFSYTVTNGTAGSVTAEPYQSLPIVLIPGTPFPSVPMDPINGSGESNIPRGVGGANVGIAPRGMFAIKLFHGGRSELAPGSGTGSLNGAYYSQGSANRVPDMPRQVCIDATIDGASGPSSPDCNGDGGVSTDPTTGGGTCDVTCPGGGGGNGGCTSCGGGGGGTSGCDAVTSATDLTSVVKVMPWNAWYPSTFSPGAFIEYDTSVYVTENTTLGMTARVFDVELGRAVLLYDFYHNNPAGDGQFGEDTRVYRSCRLKDASGNTVTTLASADHLEIVRHDGRQLRLQLYGSAGGSSGDREGRLTKLLDINGQGTTITYTGSTGRQINTATDRFGYQLTFTYGATVAGRSCATQVTLPGGQNVAVAYTGNFISSVTSPGGVKWTCGVASNPTSQTADFTVTGPKYGTRIYKVAPDYMTYNGGIISQPTNCFRASLTSTNQNLISIYPNPSNGDEVRIWYAGNKLSRLLKGQSEAFYSAWTLGNPNDGYNAFTNLTLEPTYSRKIYPAPGGSYSDVDLKAMVSCGAATSVVPASSSGAGPIVCTFNPDQFLTRADFPDGTFITCGYNGNNQLIRSRDRGGNVIKCEYDASGNLTKRIEGIREISSVDVNQPEYAEYRFDYYSTPAALKGALKTVYSPLHVSETDTLRTDYTYLPTGEVNECVFAADVTGGVRPKIQYTYNAQGRVATQVDAGGHTVSHTYDDMGRCTTTTYEDGTTDKVVYGTANTVNADRIVKRINRAKVVTTYAYDSLGNPSTVVQGAETVNGSGQYVTVSDVTKKRTTTLTYSTNTDLVLTQTVDGTRTGYNYDFRHRVSSVVQYVRSGLTQTSSTVYVNNRVFYTQDPYGRREYYGYSASNLTSLIRRVQANHAAYTLADNAAVLAVVRSSTPNAAFAVADAIKDGNGNLLEIIDPRGTSTKYSYDSRDRQTEQRNAYGTSVEAKSETIYDLAGRVVEVRSPRYFDSSDPEAARMKTLFAYNGRGQQITQTQAPGAGSAQAITSQTWTTEGKVATRTDAGGNVWTNQYENSCCGQFQGMIDPLGHGSLSNNDSMGRTVHTAKVSDYATAVNGSGSAQNPFNANTLIETTARYDNLGRPVASTTWLVAQGLIDKTNPPIAGLDSVATYQGMTTQNYYDSNLKDNIGLDNATGMAIQKLGGGTYNLSLSAVLAKLGEAETAGGGATTFGHTVSGQAVVNIGPDETIQVSISDGLGRSVMSAQLQPWNGPQPFALVSWTCQRYDIAATISGFGAVVESRNVDPFGKTTRSRSDGSARTLEAYDQENNKSVKTFDAGGNTLTIRDPNGVGYDVVYDQLGRSTSQTDTWGDTTSMTYDKEGNVRTQTDAKTKVTTIAYDARNRRTTVTDRLSGITTYNYHPAGHLASITDAETQVTGYEYNTRGEKVKEIYPDHVANSSPGDAGYGIVQFAYDPAGRMFRKTDQLGDTVTMIYNMASQMHQRDYRTLANSPTGTIADSDEFDFDQAGRMTSALSQRYSNVVSMTYDFAGRLATESLDIANQTYTVTREYDQLNRIKKYIYPDSTPVERTYTDRGQLKEIKYNGSVIDTRTYDIGGRLATSTYSNGAVTTHNYRSSGSNKDNLLASIATTNPGANKVGTYSYTWDANKNKTAETITSSPLTGYGFTTGSSGYDDENRVTAWNRDDTNQNQSWTLSLVGDWNSFTQTGTTAFNQARTHGPTHEFTSFTGTTSGTLTYDAKGNMTTRPSSLQSPALSLSWDFDNRLIGADTDETSTSLEVNFQFDALGRRVARTESNSTVVYFQAGQQTITDYALGATAASPTYRYVYGDYVDEPVMRETTSGSVKHFYHRNQQYSVTAITNNSGDTAERYTYTAYGEVKFFDGSGDTISTSDILIRHTYTGREWDSSLGTYYFRARWFDPGTGRFTNRDPLGFVDGLSLYAGYFATYGLDPSGTDIIFGNPHNFGGPDELPDGDNRCHENDTCAVLLQKYINFIGVIRSHRDWDFNHPDIRWPLGRHYQEIEELEGGLARCFRIYEAKCRLKQKPKVPCPDPVYVPEPIKIPKEVTTGVVVGCVLYWVVSEGSRFLCPPRNLLPIL